MFLLLFLNDMIDNETNSKVLITHLLYIQTTIYDNMVLTTHTHTHTHTHAYKYYTLLIMIKHTLDGWMDGIDRMNG